MTEKEVTAQDLARLLKRFANSYDVGTLGNLRTFEALVDLSEYLQKLGNVPVRSLAADFAPRRFAARVSHTDFKEMPLEQADAIIRREEITKAEMVALAQGRFGIPIARLNRSSLAEVREIVASAIDHEKSISVIDRLAGESGGSRRS